MKRSLCILLSILLTGFLTSCFDGIDKEIKYGRDTIIMFGDGTFQICRSKDTKPLVYNSHAIIPNVLQIRKIPDSDKFYVIGNDIGSNEREGKIRHWNYSVYGIIDKSNNTMQVCAVDEIESSEKFRYYGGKEGDNAVQDLKSFEEFSAEDRAIFADMKEKGDGLIEEIDDFWM